MYDFVLDDSEVRCGHWWFITCEFGGQGLAD